MPFRGLRSWCALRGLQNQYACIHRVRRLFNIHVFKLDGNLYPSSDYYEEDFLYDLKNDPFELTNLAKDDKYRDIRAQLAKELQGLP